MERGTKLNCTAFCIQKLQCPNSFVDIAHGDQGLAEYIFEFNLVCFVESVCQDDPLEFILKKYMGVFCDSIKFGSTAALDCRNS